ncbi:MAG: hypothetical protein RL514_1850 [Verrucomicrobiota bacterium]
MNCPPVCGIQLPVIRLQPLIALLLLGLWLPCTIHCQAEALGWLGSNSSCCEQGHADDSSAPDCADCATCSAIESGGYSLPQKVSRVPVLLFVALAAAPDWFALAREPAALMLPAPDSPPQWLRQSWSFRCRTALAPRAPSRLA